MLESFYKIQGRGDCMEEKNPLTNNQIGEIKVLLNELKEEQSN